MSALPVAVTLLRRRGATCSACHAPADDTVRVKADRPTARAEFLFCRRCAFRIGKVGQVIAREGRLEENGG